MKDRKINDFGDDSVFETEPFYKDLELFMYKQQLHGQGGDHVIDFSGKLRQNNWDFSYVIDFMRNQILQPRGFELFLGYKETEIDPLRMIDTIHPEDVQLISVLVKGALLYMSRHPELASGAMMRMAYRRRHKNGHYIYVLSESNVRSVDDKGRILSAFTRNLDLSFFGLHLPAQWSFTVNGEEVLNFKEEVFGKFKAIFTARELEVLFLMGQGLVNKEIAEKLNISEHTVSTHRKKIFRKSGTCGLEELLEYCRCHGIF